MGFRPAIAVVLPPPSRLACAQRICLARFGRGLAVYQYHFQRVTGFAIFWKGRLEGDAEQNNRMEDHDINIARFRREDGFNSQP